MSDAVIKVEDLSKVYRIGAAQKHDTFRDLLADWFFSRFRRLTGASLLDEKAEDTIWALRDVSFEVKQGEIIGIIGKNGSGKSTLLKILSRITEPSRGSAKINGRVSSLLEVGTGFHPELTGRQNIFLNGAILGMKRAEIKSNFDEIVEFAEIGKFIDTPVKRYSSGMFVRLAFAVAAHLQPEILLIDEVLAVGDVAFQKKCLGKMEDVTKGGRTILFVTHSMASVGSICNRAMLLSDGEIAAQGPVPEVVATYLSSGRNTYGEVVCTPDDLPGSDLVQIRAIRVLDEQGEVTTDVDIAKPVDLEIEFSCLQKTNMSTVFHVYAYPDVLLFMATNQHEEVWGQQTHYEPGVYRCSCRLPGNFLNEGEYFINAYLSHNISQTIDVSIEQAISFRAHDFGSSQDGTASKWLGLVRPQLPWKRTRVEDLP